MTVITGAPSPSRAIASARVLTVADTVRCRACVPHCTDAAGVSGGIPPATSAAAMRGSVLTPMYSTIVPPARASAAQSVCVSGLAGSSCPVTKVTEVATPRCVTGMPAYAGAAIPAVTPGTISKAIPAAARACASSLPRPKTSGSPPFRRTTRLPARPSFTSSALIASCPIELASPPRLPTSCTSTDGLARRASATIAGLARASTAIASQVASRSRPRTVSSPGSPGPAPTRCTIPALPEATVIRAALLPVCRATRPPRPVQRGGPAWRAAVQTGSPRIPRTTRQPRGRLPGSSRWSRPSQRPPSCASRAASNARSSASP